MPEEDSQCLRSVSSIASFSRIALTISISPPQVLGDFYKVMGHIVFRYNGTGLIIILLVSILGNHINLECNPGEAG